MHTFCNHVTVDLPKDANTIDRQECIMPSREEAYALVTSKISNRNLVKHMLSLEAIMRELAPLFDGDPELWGLAGLVHDVDYMETEKDPKNHALLGAKLLEELGYPADLVQAVAAHNPENGTQIKTKMDLALYVGDPLTGLIVACALIHPAKKLEPIDVDFVTNRFGEKRFAAGANRDQIARCAELGLDLPQFVDIGLRAMKKISKELGL
jgi:putative nucleotidyltransferase with HDIG domain